MEVVNLFDKKDDFMDQNKLIAVFLDVYFDFLKKQTLDEEVNKKEYIKEYINMDSEHKKNMGEELEKYIVNILGNKIKDNYDEYIREIMITFENVIGNSPNKSLTGIINYIPVYSKMYFEQIYQRPLSAIFINTIKQMISDDVSKVTVSNRGLKYVIGKLDVKGEEEIPKIIIKNIDNLECTLNDLIDKIMKSDTFFKNPLLNFDGDQGVSYLIEWIMRNATSNDLSNVESFLKKYTHFITDNTFDQIKKIKHIGVLLGYDVYVMRKRSSVNYETPYYLAYYMVKDNIPVELPNVRFGVENKGSNKIFHILSTQTSQDNVHMEEYYEICKQFKSYMGKSKFFREFNPTHVISLFITFGLIKGIGIDTVKVADYLPLRFYRLVLENQQSEEELYNLQSRLVDKNIYNYLRISELFSGINIQDYVDNGDGLLIHLEDEIVLNDLFSQKLYNLGYNASLEMNKDYSSQKHK